MSRTAALILPVRSLSESERFYAGLGLRKLEAHRSATSVGVELAEGLPLILQTASAFEEPLAEGDSALLTSHAKEVRVRLTLSGTSDVDRLCVLAASHGGTIYRKAEQRYGCYGAVIADPDGHLLELCLPE